MHDIQGDDSAIGLDVDNSKVQDDYDNNGLPFGNLFSSPLALGRAEGTVFLLL